MSYLYATDAIGVVTWEILWLVQQLIVRLRSAHRKTDTARSQILYFLFHRLFAVVCHFLTDYLLVDKCIN